MIKAILWDVDRTLLDFDAAQAVAIRKCFETHNLGVCDDDMLSDYDKINHKYWNKLEKKEISKNEVLINRFKEFFDKYNIKTDIESFNDEYQIRLGDTAIFFENGKYVTDTLKEIGVYQCAVTNGTKIAQDKKLANSGLINVFDDIYISDVIKHEKPSKEFFEPVIDKLNKLNISKDETLIIGDSLSSDIQGGVNIGIKTCWFNTKHALNNTTLRIDYEIDNLIQVLDIIKTCE